MLRVVTEVTGSPLGPDGATAGGRGGDGGGAVIESGEDTPDVVAGDGAVDAAADPDTLGRADVRGLDEARPYRPDSPYAAVLARCALAQEPADFCTLETLPFVEQENERPTVEDVMERVLVTHDWMGERFERFLVLHAEELLPLFGAVTSVVIGSTVRPSFYWSATGGMQLDPERLWLDVAEKRTVSITEDYRAPYRRLLAFRDYRQLLRDDRRAAPFFDLEDFSERTFDDIEVGMMNLLFHELAHARDFLPPGTAPSLDRSKTPADALGEISNAWLSPSLAARLPLNSMIHDERGPWLDEDR